MEFFVPTLKNIEEIKEALAGNQKKCCDRSGILGGKYFVSFKR